jgi:hypothetical protein
LEPKGAAAFLNNRGLARHSMNDHDGAIADFSEVIRLAPNYALAYYNRANTHISKGESDRAIADYTDAIRLDPNFVTAYYNRGITYRAKDDHDRAIADYTVAIGLNPKYGLAYYTRGNAYRDKGDSGRATADYTEANKLGIKLDSACAAARIRRRDRTQQRGRTSRIAPKQARSGEFDRRGVAAYCWAIGCAAVFSRRSRPRCMQARPPLLSTSSNRTGSVPASLHMFADYRRHDENRKCDRHQHKHHDEMASISAEQDWPPRRRISWIHTAICACCDPPPHDNRRRCCSGGYEKKRQEKYVTHGSLSRAASAPRTLQPVCLPDGRHDALPSRTPEEGM